MFAADADGVGCAKGYYVPRWMVIGILRHGAGRRLGTSAANEAGLGKSVQEDDGHSTHGRLWPPVQIVAKGSSRVRLGAPHISSTDGSGGGGGGEARPGSESGVEW